MKVNVASSLHIMVFLRNVFTGSCGVRLVLGKEMLTKLTWSHSGSETVKYHWKLLQVALGMYTQVTRVQRVGTPQTS